MFVIFYNQIARLFLVILPGYMPEDEVAQKAEFQQLPKATLSSIVGKADIGKIRQRNQVAGVDFFPPLPGVLKGVKLAAAQQR